MKPYLGREKNGKSSQKQYDICSAEIVLIPRISRQLYKDTKRLDDVCPSKLIVSYKPSKTELVVPAISF